MAKTNTSPTQLADGIYVGLPEAVYHNDMSLGSTDIRNLLKGPNEFWRHSKFNPKRKPWKTDATILGSAVHKFLLEGREAMDEIYVRGPYNGDDDLTPGEKSALTKAAKAKLMEDQELLTADDYDFVLELASVFDRDPDLHGALEGGLSEVSVFWTRRGIRMKCRFDKLKLGGFGDLKTIANQMGDEIVGACYADIHRRLYDVQMEHYLEGRSHLPDLVSKGAIFIDQTHHSKLPVEPAKQTVDFLQTVAARKTFAAQIIFIPKPPNAADAFSTVFSPQNERMTSARGLIEHALNIYDQSMERWPVDKGLPWLPARKVTECPTEELPSYPRRIFTFED